MTLVLGAILAGCERSAPRVPVASTAGLVEVAFVSDGYILRSGPVLVSEEGDTIGIGDDMSGQVHYCDADTPFGQRWLRVADPETEEVLWERRVSSFLVCPEDRLLWDGEEMRRLEPDEDWPPGITIKP